MGDSCIIQTLLMVRLYWSCQVCCGQIIVGSSDALSVVKTKNKKNVG
jgi:hypothetical protein